MTKSLELSKFQNFLKFSTKSVLTFSKSENCMKVMNTVGLKIILETYDQLK